MAKFHLGNLAKDIATRTTFVAQRSMPRITAWLQRAASRTCRETRQPTDGHKTTAERRVDSDSLL
jgi:hypothetical protein